MSASQRTLIPDERTCLLGEGKDMTSKRNYLNLTIAVPPLMSLGKATRGEVIHDVPWTARSPRPEDYMVRMEPEISNRLEEGVLMEASNHFFKTSNWRRFGQLTRVAADSDEIVFPDVGILIALAGLWLLIREILIENLP